MLSRYLAFNKEGIARILKKYITAIEILQKENAMTQDDLAFEKRMQSTINQTYVMRNEHKLNTVL